MSVASATAIHADAQLEQARIEEITNAVAAAFLADLRHWYPGIAWTRVTRTESYDRAEGTARVAASSQRNDRSGEGDRAHGDDGSVRLPARAHRGEQATCR